MFLLMFDPEGGDGKGKKTCVCMCGSVFVCILNGSNLRRGLLRSGDEKKGENELGEFTGFA